jgi:nucleotidyltransferase/DNA polymerase involved in DNA repair
MTANARTLKDASPPRTILHVDMDQFYAAVEIKRHPELKGKPLVVGSDPKGGKGRGVVSAASYEARRFGVHSALPISTAWRLCPQGVFLPVDMPAYVAASAEIHEVFEALTPLVEPISLDEAFLDVSGSRLMVGDGEACARHVQAEVFRKTALSCSVGVASNKFIAKIASDLKKPGGLVVVPPGQERGFLAPLEVGRLWGVGKVAEKKLRSLGIRTIGDMANWQVRPLSQALGAGWAEHLLALARGEDSRDVQSERESKSVGRETTFDVDTRDIQLLRRTLGDLAEDVSSRLRRLGWTCQTLQLKYRFEGFETHTRQRPLRPTSDHGPDLFLCAWQELRAVLKADARRLRLVGLSAMNLEDASASGQEDLFGPSRAKLNRLNAAVDAVRKRHGEERVKRGNQSPADQQPSHRRRTGFSPD